LFKPESVNSIPSAAWTSALAARAVFPLAGNVFVSPRRRRSGAAARTWTWARACAVMSRSPGRASRWTRRRSPWRPRSVRRVVGPARRPRGAPIAATRRSSPRSPPRRFDRASATPIGSAEPRRSRTGWKGREGVVRCRSCPTACRAAGSMSSARGPQPGYVSGCRHPARGGRAAAPRGGPARAALRPTTYTRIHPWTDDRAFLNRYRRHRMESHV